MSEIETQIQTLEKRLSDVEQRAEKIKRERAEATDQFNRKQKLFEEMFS